MRVILKQDVKKVGKKGEVVEVSDGYGRNYLVARNLAVVESKRGLEILGEQKKEEAAQEAAEVEKAKETAKLLEKTVLEFRVKSGENGKVFGSVSTKQIVEELRKKDIRIDKRKIIDTYPIASLGTTKVKVELHHGVIGTVNVHLTGSEK